MCASATLHRLIRVGITCFALTLCLDAQSNISLQASGASEDVYKQVLDLKFGLPPKIEPRTIAALTIRIVPSFAPESQITVTLFDGKSPQVEYVTAGENVNKTINELREKTDNMSPEALAKGVTVNRSVFEVPSSRVFEWLQGLSESLGPSLTALTSEAENRYHTGTGILQLDGTTYEVSYAQFLSGFHVDTGESPTGDWAEKVRAEVVQLAQNAQ